MSALTIGVLSDTHMPHMGKHLPRAVVEGMRAARVDVLVHCGDMLDASAIPELEAIAPLQAIAGNNDSFDLLRRFGRKKILRFGSVRIGMVHGHGAPGRERTPDHAFAQFKNEDVHAVLFGHSHVPLCEWREKRLLFNPGSPTDKRRQAQYSYGLLRICEGRIEPELRFFASKEP
ncbi:MAG: metallophosphoesterase [Candidatus Baltobacteraceae bacterium]